MIWYKYESYIILIHHIQSYTLSLYCTYNSSPRFPMSPLLNLPSPIMPSAATRHIPWEPTTAVRALWPMFEDPSPWGPKPRCSLEIFSPKGLLVCNLKTHGFKRREKRPKSSKWRKSIMWTDYNIYIYNIYILYTVRFWDFDGVKMRMPQLVRWLCHLLGCYDSYDMIHPTQSKFHDLPCRNVGNSWKSMSNSLWLLYIYLLYCILTSS